MLSEYMLVKTYVCMANNTLSVVSTTDQLLP